MEDLHVSLKLCHIINFILCEGNRLRLRRSFVTPRSRIRAFFNFSSSFFFHETRDPILDDSYSTLVD